jgi:hypothetical protein
VRKNVISIICFPAIYYQYAFCDFRNLCRNAQNGVTGDREGALEAQKFLSEAKSGKLKSDEKKASKPRYVYLAFLSDLNSLPDYFARLESTFCDIRYRLLAEGIVLGLQGKLTSLRYEGTDGETFEVPLLTKHGKL